VDFSFNSNGKETLGFNLGGNHNDVANAVVLQPDGQIVLAGSAVNAGDNTDFAVARVGPTGVPDESFGPSGKRTVAFDLGGNKNDVAFGLAVQADGKIVVVGSAQIDTTAFVYAVVRLNADGTPDATFGPGGKRTVAISGGVGVDQAHGVAVQPDGKIVVVGLCQPTAGNFDMGAVRLNPDGTRDTGFGPSGIRVIPFDLGGSKFDAASAVSLQPDGRIVLTGFAQLSDTNRDFAAARLKPDGTLDPTFGVGGKTTVAFDLGGANSASDTATCAVLQPDGKLIMAGSVQASAANNDFGVARLNTDGSLDTSFGNAGKSTFGFSNNEGATGVALQADGKIVVAGSTDFPGNQDFVVARLNPNGFSDLGFGSGGKTIDSFNSGGTTSDQANAVALQPDGKIVVAGSAEMSGGNLDFGVARLEGANVHFLAVGGAPDRVEVFGRDGAALGTFSPFAGYSDGVAVALGDVNEDGIDDLITSATVGNPAVKIYSGATLSDKSFFTNPEGHLLASGFAYGINFNVGANIAAGDVNGDGFADLVTGAAPGNPHVKLFDGKKLLAAKTISPDNDPSQLAQGFVYGINFNVGANVAVGDVNGDGLADIVTGATAGNPHTKVFDAKRVLASGTFPTNVDASLLAQFFPYGINFNVGAFVAVGDYNRDGFADVVTGASIGNPEVRVFSGKDIAQGTFNATTSLLDFYFAFEQGQNIGVSVAAGDFTGDGRADVVAGTRSGTPRHRVFQDNLPGAATVLSGLDVTDGGFTGALYVGA
jgi:uncharacterized delta-60 repeat protein